MQLRLPLHAPFPAASRKATPEVVAHHILLISEILGSPQLKAKAEAMIRQHKGATPHE